jgi:hypothetical protein
MKQFFGLIVVITMMLSCTNNTSKCALTREDSLRICKIINQEGGAGNQTSRQNGDSLPKYSFKSDFKPKLVIPFGDANTLHKNYLQNPITSIVNSNQDLIRGFRIEKNDFDKIKTTATNGARIYFGYDTVDGEYRMMLVGVDAKNANVVSVIIDDFLPCPDHCTISDPSGTPAQRQVRFESDLNYISTDAQRGEVEYMEFGGTSRRIRYQ